MTKEEAVDKFMAGELVGDDSEEACEALRLIYDIPCDARMRFVDAVGWQVNVEDLSLHAL